VHFVALSGEPVRHLSGVLAYTDRLRPEIRAIDNDPQPGFSLPGGPGKFQFKRILASSAGIFNELIYKKNREKMRHCS
jgi:hypothetical protein